jgi:carbamate kinase
MISARMKRMIPDGKTLVIALGGNSIMPCGQKGTLEEQHENLLAAANGLLEILASNNRIVVTYGNGPQVGNLLLAMDAARDLVPLMPLDLCVGATQGFMGSMIQVALANSLHGAGVKRNLTLVLSNVIVDR